MLDKYYRSGGFQKVFRDYLVANFTDTAGLSQDRFAYPNRDVQVVAAGTETSSSEDATVFPYGGEYFDLTASGSFDATAQDPVAVIPARDGQPAPGGGYFAWSNRGDEMLTWMERRANLTNATAPVLQFKYWHQIEEDWDYAYVRVSKDNGASYEYVPTPDCGGRATDPNGNNRAIAESGGITGDSGGWQACSLDLAAYAGGPVLIRFEYDTDQSTTEPGYVVDNVSLTDGNKKIWHSSKFEKKERAWSFAGDSSLRFMRLRPLAKNKPLFQLVSITGDEATRTVLKRKKFKASEAGLDLRKPVPLRGDRTIVIFSGVTPIATDPFAYSYRVE